MKTAAITIPIVLLGFGAVLVLGNWRRDFEPPPFDTIETTRNIIASGAHQAEYLASLGQHEGAAKCYRITARHADRAGLMSEARRYRLLAAKQASVALSQVGNRSGADADIRAH